MNIVKHHETNVIRCDDIGARAETSSLDAETSAHGDVGARRRRRTATSAIARSYRRYRRGVFGDIGDCGVGITPQMCNRITNHGDMSTFSKPGRNMSDDTVAVSL